MSRGVHGVSRHRAGVSRAWIAAALAGSLFVTACTRDDGRTLPPPTGAPGTTGTTGARTPDVVIDGSGDDLDPPEIVLTDAAPEPLRADPVPVLAGEPLDQTDIDDALGRLPEWELPADDAATTNLPPERLDPPIPGATIDTPFPPPVDPPVDPTEQPPAGPLMVLRYQPDGDVATAPFLSVTFDQPMVPVATIDQLAAIDVPVQLEPAVEGRWRWIGTRTARFEVVPDGDGSPDRLPAATEYTVTVPAGTTSANGAVLAEAVSWTFATPAPTVTSLTGVGEAMPLDPVLVAVFDQRVDPAAVLATVTLTAGGEPVALRPATDAEVAADEAAQAATAAAQPAYAVAFVPEAALPVDSPIELTVGPGTPSAEGPRTSPEPFEQSGRTYGALRVADHGCQRDQQRCQPGDTLFTSFSNPLDSEGLGRDELAEVVTIAPAIPGAQIRTQDSWVEIVGATAARTTYTVTFAAELTDVYGQTLGQPATVTFEVGSADPALRGFSREFVTVDPMSPTPQVSFSSINHETVQVTAWAVSPSDARRFREFLDESYSDTRPDTPDWPVVFDDEVAIDAERDTWTETFVDLSDAFAEAGDQLVVRIAPTLDIARDSETWWQNRPTIAWVQHTTLGVDAFTDGERLVVWTTDLTTGEPVADVSVALLGTQRTLTTDDEGLATVVQDGSLGVLVATAGERTAMLVGDWWGDRSGGGETPAQSRWYVVDDRGIYRPGETVRVAGWVREFAWEDDAQLRQYGQPGDSHTIDYIVYDGSGVEFTRGSASTNALAGFNLEVALPDGANLGQGWVELHVSGPGVNENNGYFHYFQIQEFRRPEFEVTTRTATPPPYFLAGGAQVAVDATYYAGGPLAGAAVQWLISSSDTSYSPPGWDEYRFGVYTPWWWDFGGRSMVSDIECWECPGTATTYEEFAGRTDADGTHALQIGFASADDVADDLPRTVTAEATVFDVNRQAWTDRTSLLVHPAAQYVGLRSDRGFVEQGTPIRIDAIVADIDGAVVPGRPVTITAGRVTWDADDAGVWAEQVVDVQTCEFASGETAHECEFTTDAGGEYRITATVTDAGGQHNRSETTVWVSGAAAVPTRGVEQQPVTIVPAADDFAPGDTAELLVQAPFAPATGSYIVSHGPIRETHTFTAEDGSAVLRIPIGADDVPNLNVAVEMVGVAPRTNDDGTPAPNAPARPAFATGRLSLPVSLAERTLTVTATPAAEALEPGADTSVTVAVTSADGAPVEGAGVALVVVDEAVLALSGYELADPLGVFYGELGDQLWDVYGRSSIVLTRTDLAGGAPTTVVPPEAPAATDAASMEDGDAAPAPAGGAEELSARVGDDSTGGAPQVAVRDNFDALAVFAPDEVTGADGTVTVDLQLPDSLTRYRVMAVAVGGATDFGKGEASLTARLPLMARPSAPRFLNFGDVFELPVVLQNQTDQDLEVLVAVETSNLTLTGPVGKRVTVPANDRVEVRFPAAAAEVGTARYRVVAVSADAALGFADAAAGELPVYTPATAEAFATYGVLDGGAAVGQPVLAPTGVLAEFGGLEVTTSSTAVSALTDAVLYIADYPYRSSDALAGRILSITTLGDVLAAFGVDGLPAPEVLDQRVVDDIAALVRLRNDDGGWGWFTRGLESDPWLSVTATHALVVAQAAGFGVPEADLAAALAFLADIESHIPAEWGAEARHAVRSYALYVRHTAGAGDPAKAATVYAEGGGSDMQLDAMAWLWPAIDDPGIREEIARTLANRAVDTAGATTFATSYGEDAYLIAASDRRTDAIVLDALITESPDSDLVVKTVAGLMAGQRQGRWNNVYENSFALIALHRYFTTFESVTPDFVARAWLGDAYVAEHDFAGRSPDRSHTLVPMADVLAGGDTSLIVANDGVGRLYYRLGVRYAPADLTLAARDEGFVVDRVYEAVDDPADVTRDADGTWHIRAGAKVRVRLTMVADAVRTHVALIDPLPAGLEALNPALAISQTVPPADDTDDDPADAWWGWGWWHWYEHENLGDDRVEAYASYLPGGTYEYEYIARATTPGQFVVPPTRAEQIYAPEVFGRAASTVVVVSDQ